MPFVPNVVMLAGQLFSQRCVVVEHGRDQNLGGAGCFKWLSGVWMLWISEVSTFKRLIFFIDRRATRTTYEIFHHVSSRMQIHIKKCLGIRRLATHVALRQSERDSSLTANVSYSWDKVHILVNVPLGHTH